MQDKILAFTEENGVTLASQKFNLSPFQVRKLTNWNMEKRKVFNQKQRIKLEKIRKERRKETNRLWSNLPEVKKRRLAWTRQWKKQRPFTRIITDANNRLGGDIKPFDLWKIAKHQKMTCPYSGLRLTNENISLEHIIPISKGGKNEIENIRLVHVWANLMKLNYSLEEFKIMVSLINSMLNEGIKKEAEFFNPASPFKHKKLNVND